MKFGFRDRKGDRTFSKGKGLKNSWWNDWLVISIQLSMSVHLSVAATVPGRQQCATLGALVFDVLSRVHEIGDAAETGKTEGDKTPDVGSVTRLETDSSKAALSAHRAVNGRRSAVERAQRNGALELLRRNCLAWGRSTSLFGWRLRVHGLVGVAVYRLGVLLALSIGRRRALLLVLVDLVGIMLLVGDLLLCAGVLLLRLLVLLLLALVIDGRLAGSLLFHCERLKM